MSKTTRKGKSTHAKAKTSAKKTQVKKTTPAKTAAKKTTARTLQAGDIILSKHRYSVVNEVLKDSVACTYVDLVERRANSMQERLVLNENINAVFYRVK